MWSAAQNRQVEKDWKDQDGIKIQLRNTLESKDEPS